MKTLIVKPVQYLCLIVLFASSPLISLAAGGNEGLYTPSVRVQPTNINALKRGFAGYMQNCITCHSLGLLRYNRISEDLHISEEQMRQDGLLPANAKMLDYIHTALDPAGALDAYGIVPPDLSLKARERGVNWVHGMLTGFYQDANSKTGFNNVVMNNTAMPHLLAGMQGVQVPIYSDDHGKKVLTGLELSIPGQLNQKKFYENMRDITSFLRYASEPSIIQRHALGVYVIGFLLILLVLTYLLKREYWRDIH